MTTEPVDDQIPEDSEFSAAAENEIATCTDLQTPWWKLLVLPVSVLVLVAVVSTLLVVFQPAAVSSIIEERAWAVQVVSARKRSIQPVIRSSGTVVAGRTADLRPLAPGRIIALSTSVVEGGVVSANERLFEIDPFEYQVRRDETESALLEARSRRQQTERDLAAEQELVTIDREQLRLRRRDLQRKRDLLQTKSISPSAVDAGIIAANDARQKLRSRERSIEALRAKLTQEGYAIQRAMSSLARSSRDVANTVVLAPFSGFLTDINLALGKYVSPNDTLARLIDADRLEVRLQLSETEFARFNTRDPAQPRRGGLIGRRGEVVWHIGTQRFLWKARISRIASEIDRNSGGVIVFARIENVGINSVLRPGAFVEMSIPDNEYHDVLVLPERAVGQDGRIYIVEQGRLRAIQADIQRRGGGQLLVRADIPDGAQVVARLFAEIGPGLRVTPILRKEGAGL